MSKSKQSTLFQSWGGRSQRPDHTISKRADVIKRESSACTSSGITSAARDTAFETIDLCSDDEEDRELVKALEASVTLYQNTNAEAAASNVSNNCSFSKASDDANAVKNGGNISFGIDDNVYSAANNKSQCLSQWRTDVPVGDLRGFDCSTGAFWIYPTNYPVREYQFNIVKKALVKNTLVTLPTGLGKTFIASVVMYNFYRWYPEGKIVFMAPTKPLVAQQIEACYNIMGIPQEDTAEMTGTMNPSDRQISWQNKRVFFLTPQVLTNDLSRGSCSAVAIKCLVVDEAHKALGNHAYCQVVRELVKYTKQFRVLALSATPGSDLKAVQQVMSNLLISHIELRSEDCADIKPYTHERTVEKVVVPLGDELTTTKTQYIKVLTVVVQRLVNYRVLYKREPTSLSKFLILKAREAFRQNPPESLLRSQYGVIEGDFAMAMSLYHGYELLQLHGLRSLYTFLDGIISGEKSHNRTRTELLKNVDFNQIMEILQKKFKPQLSSNDQIKSKHAFLVGHPKMEKLEQIVLEHFHKFDDVNKPTRVMIFAQYRDTVLEITELLQQHEPLVKVMSFIGQSSNGKSTKGFTQKEQLKVMHAFRNGGYNTLVSTCVGEEGLDIGEVDLIVCFDAHKSPIRLVQRMGRTGRKRQGRIVMLVTEGKEEQIYNQSQYSKRSIHRAILNGARNLVFYNNNPRMIPEHLTPACHRMHITVRQPHMAAKQQKMQGTGRKSYGNISELFTARKKESGLKKCEQELISLEEYAELRSAGFQAPSKCLPRPIMVSLQSKSSDCTDDKEQELNLAEWLPWQNALQQASLFSHSRRSKHLVDLLEFIDLQQLLPPGEDNYGQEMHLYLNMDDVFGNSKQLGAGDITQLCVPTQRDKKLSAAVKEKTSKQLGKEKSEEDKSKRTKLPCKKRHVAVLEILEESDEESDFLPDVDLSVPSESLDDVTTCLEINQKFSMKGKMHISYQKCDGKKARSGRRNISGKRNFILDADDLDDFEVGANFQEERTLAEQQKPSEERFMEEDAQSSTKAGIYAESLENSEVFLDDEGGSSSVHNIDDHEHLPQVPETEKDICESTVDKDMLYMSCVPSPPNCKDIPLLLDSLELFEDSLSLDLQALAVQCRSFLFSSKLLSSFSAQRQVDIVNEEKEEDCATHFDDIMNGLDETNKQPIMWNDNSESEETMNSVSERMPAFEHVDAKGVLFSSIEDNEKTEKRKFTSEILNLGKKVECGSNRMFKAGNRHNMQAKSKELFLQRSLPQISKPSKVCTRKADQDGTEPGKDLTLLSSVEEEVENTGNLRQTNPDSFIESFIKGDFQGDNYDVFDHKVKIPPVVTGAQAQSHSKQETSDVVHLLDSSASCVTSARENFFPKTSPCRNDSIYTFTQALDFVHNHSSMDHNPYVSHKHSQENFIAEHKKQNHFDEGCSVSPATTHLTSCMEQSSAIDFMKHSLHQEQSKQIEDAPDKIEKNIEQDSPNFDLDFDFDDEDIIPPSPEAGLSVYQSTSNSQAYRMSKQSLINAPPATSEHEKKNNIQHAAEVCDFDSDDDVLVGISDQDEDQCSTCFAPSFNSASSAVALFTNKHQDSKIKASEDIGDHHVIEYLSTDTSVEKKAKFVVTDSIKVESKNNSSVCFENLDRRALAPSQEFHCHQESNPDISVARCIGFCQAYNNPEPEHFASFALQLDDDFDDMCNEQENTVELGDDEVNSQVQPPLTTEVSIHNFHCDVQEDSGFHNPASEKLEDHILKDGAKTPLQISMKGPLTTFCCSTPVSNRKLGTFYETPHASDSTPGPTTRITQKLKLHFGEDSESDFEDSVIVRQRSRALQLLSPGTSDGDASHTTEKGVSFKVPAKSFSAQMNRKEQQKKKKHKKRCPFLDEEAELSEDVDVSTDEEEDNLDVMENSFIDNDTQLTQASHTDMQAVYLKSVRSPSFQDVGANAGRFRLQYNHAMLDVFSQSHAVDTEESQYEKDSFCVGSEEEKEDEDNVDETEDEDYDLMVINRRPQKTGVKRRKAVNSRLVKGRKRVRQIVDSSDEEEKAERLSTSQVTLELKTSRSIKALLSSSEDNTDLSVLKQSPSNICDKEDPDDQISHQKLCAKSETRKNMDTKCSQGFNCQQQASELDSCLTDIDWCIEDFPTEPPLQKGKSTEVTSGLGEKTIHKHNYDTCEQSGTFQHQHSELRVEKRSESVAAHGWSQKLDLLKKWPSTASNILKPDKNDGSELDYIDAKGSESVKRKVMEFREASTSECDLPPNDISDFVNKTESRLSSADSRISAADLLHQKREDNNDQTQESTVQFTSLLNKERGKVVILIDSREVCGAQDVVSALRLQHNLHVCTWQLKACDYILSNRMGVERLSWSGLINSANRSKLCDRLRQMQLLYDRCILIVEKDRVKSGEENTARNQHHSKYLDSVLSQLNQTSVRVFFTDNQGETATLLAGLANAETQKEMAIMAPVSLLTQKQQMINFYMSVPLLTVTHTLNICYNFNTIQKFFQSSVADIQRKGKMSFARATEVYNYFRHRFAAELLPRNGCLFGTVNS